MTVARLLATLALTSILGSAAVGCATARDDEPQAQDEGALRPLEKRRAIEVAADAIKSFPPQGTGITFRNLPASIKSKLEAEFDHHKIAGGTLCEEEITDGAKPTIGKIIKYEGSGVETFYAVEVTNPELCPMKTPGNYGPSEPYNPETYDRRFFDREIWFFSESYERRVAIGQYDGTKPAAWIADGTEFFLLDPNDPSLPRMTELTARDAPDGVDYF